MFYFTSWNFRYFNVIFALSLISSSQLLPVEQNNRTPRATYGNDVARSLNELANPCTDFYEYTCGHWTDHHIPAEGFPIWSNWYIISHDLKPKIENLLKDTDSETDNEAIRKARKVYRACMNKAKIEELGAEPIKSIINDNGGWPLIMKPGEWSSKNLTWQQIHSKLERTLGTGALYSIQIVIDPRNSSVRRFAISEPDFFLKKKELIAPGKFALSLAYNLYKIKVANVFKRSESSLSQEDELLSEGYDSAERYTELSNFESELAQITHDEQGIKEIDKWYTLMTVDELQQLYDSANMTSGTAKINWLETLRDSLTLVPEITVNGSEQVIVPGKDFFPKLAELLNRTSPETIVNYMMWRTIVDASLYTNDELRNLLITLNNKRVGADPIGSREYDCVSSSQMERAVSYAFVKKHFSPDSKQAVLELVANIQEAMNAYIRQSSWLDDETKKVATEKIDAITKFIGYPDDYDATKMDEYYSEYAPTDSYFENEMRRRVFMMKKIMRTLRKPTEKNKWPIEPNAVNAYYILVMNTILVPAGILQPPLFDASRPSVINYGMIGATIGHEISHALDSNGRRFDKNGNAVTWWSQPAIDKYEEHAQCFIHQFNNYTIYEDESRSIPVNGILTLEENISDSTGLQVTWDAYKIYREKHGTNGVKIPGLERFTDDQIFFLAFGHLWCAYESNMYLQQYSPDDVHSPAKVRVNGAVSNVKAFAAAFNCPENSTVNPLNKCNIWQ
ncbi:membrane metallo-endopeptidase-like 1 [Diachasmimorpha longicaudata]|uniref:membrane metallo-endopeptidase-like 1 n=1 Tax=Diachasmimorpha longicaudata TaxID=58733 RepID=UPI0030B883DF